MPDVALQLEMSFLEHRLEVIELWPDSPRKTATRTAILHRLEMLPRGYGLQPPATVQSSPAAVAAHF